MTTIGAALRDGAKRLADAGIESAARDARWLMAHVLGVGPDRITVLTGDPFPTSAEADWNAAIAARARLKPVAQITGRRAFYGHDFKVTEDTLDPRPETELLVDEALKRPFVRMLDLGTGTGCILLSCLSAMRVATGIGTDISPAALAVAQTNAEALGLGARARFRVSDWFSDVQDRFDLIVSNPPYIAEHEMHDLSPEVRDWEPRIALTPEGDGLDAYRAITRGAPARLLAGGRLLVEIGWQQGQDVATLFAEAGLADISIVGDLEGRDRVVTGTKPQE